VGHGRKNQLVIAKVAGCPGWPVGWHLAAYKILSPGHVQHASRTAWKKIQPLRAFLLGDLSYTKEGHAGGNHACLFLWAVGQGCAENWDSTTGSTMRPGQKRSCFSQHTSSKLPPRTSPRMKAVLRPARGHVTARHGWNQPWGAELPRAPS